MPPPVAEQTEQPAPEVGGDQTHAVDQPDVPACDKVLHDFNFTLHPSSVAWLSLSLLQRNLLELREKSLKWRVEGDDSSLPGYGPPNH